MTTFINSLLSILRRLERIMIISINLIMVGLYSFNVIIREFMPSHASSFAWIDEATRLLMVWAVFLALGLALERGRHVAVTTIYEKLPTRIRKVVAFLINITGFSFSAYFTYLAIELVKFVSKTGQLSPTLGIPMYWLYVAPSVGFVLLAIRYFLELTGVNNRHERPRTIAEIN